MEIKDQCFIVLRILSAMILGGLIGFERERDGKVAGIRTYAAVCMGACIYTLVGVYKMDVSGESRVVANIITGIGFLGAGIIFRDLDKHKTTGLTTAATVWATAGVGVAVGYDLFLIAIVSALAIYFLLSLHHVRFFQNMTQNIKKDSDEEGIKKNDQYIPPDGNK